MSKSLTDFKKMTFLNKVKSTLDNWKKIIVILFAVTIVSSGVSCLVYHAWPDMTTYEERVEGHYVEKTEPVKKAQFLLHISTYAGSIFLMLLFSFDMFEDDYGKSTKDKWYKFISDTIIVHLCVSLSFYLLYYIGSYISPLIFT